MVWRLRAIGSSKGIIRIPDNYYRLEPGVSEISLPEGQPLDEVEILSKKGKFADSEDSFLFLYTVFDPRRENIELCARFEVLDMEEIPDYQTGYGILAADTVFSSVTLAGGTDSRHRNHLLAGRFRTSEGMNHGYGLRAVSGYTSPDADEFGPVRMLDPTRTFNYQDECDQICSGDTCAFRLSKTDKGFIASMRHGNEWESITFPGCDLLMQQDKEQIAIGFAVAGKARIRLSDIKATKMKGSSSITPKDAVRCVIPDYPFRRDLFDDCFQTMRGQIHTSPERMTGDVLYAAPDGRPCQDGSVSSPMDLHTALASACEGTEIILLDGIYKLSEPVYLPSWSGGSFQRRNRVHAQHARKAILDGSALKKKAPLVVLRGRYWILEGIIFRNSPLSGLFVCGSGNRILDCEAHHNGDTGILICAYPGEERERWPGYNCIEGCDSYDNYDPVLCNADGFGAKLSIGKGNVFYRCIAHHNIDDGFDLYTKSILGPTEPVLLEQCTAYENGRTLESKHIRRSHSGGIGFKLGGEHQSVPHEVWDCSAFLNEQAGISLNTNPVVRLHYCTAVANGSGDGKSDFILNGKKDRTSRQFVGLLPPVSGKVGKAFVRNYTGSCKEELKKGKRPFRNEDGSIVLPCGNRGGLFPHAGAITDSGQRRKILMMITTLGGGGAERVTSILASELAKRNIVYLMTMYHKERTYQVSSDVVLIDDCWNVRSFIERYFHIPVRWPFKAYKLLRLKQRYHIDTTISMLHMPNLYNGMIRWRDSRIMSERNDPSRKPSNEFRDAKRSYAKADHVVFQSEYVKAMFSKDIQDKSSIIRNPIRVSCFADREPQNRIVTVGRYSPQKNHALLIQAFSIFYRINPNYTLHLYGDGELSAKLQSQIEELQLQNVVFLEGFKENIHEFIRNAKMFVLSSDYEGMSNALMEAMMMGIPCISTNCTGSVELLENEKNGLLVPMKDPEALACAMGKLANNEALRRKFRDQAQLCCLGFETEIVVRAWERILFR